MRHNHHTYLCIGGPLAGKRYVNNAPYFKAPVLPPLSTAIINGYDELLEVTVNTIEYERDSIATREGYIMFWVPRGQTPEQTLELLLATYEQANALQR